MTTIISAILLLCFTFFSLLSPSTANVLGFSADLIHRDSPASPYYDPSLAPLDRVLKALRHSHNRIKHFISASKNVNSTSSELIPISVGYLMKITLGTPPIDILASVDTGSDLTWISCAPCSQCHKQKVPLFNPKESSTYRIYPYNSSKCRNVDMAYNDTNGSCGYKVKYGDNSYCQGTLASETLTLGSNSSQPVSFPGITIGCSYKDGGNFEEVESGLVGLGGGTNSLVSQIKPFINDKFSYCLTPTFSDIKIKGQINFGNNAIVSGKRAVSTPIIPKSPKMLYFLNLEAISVGRHRIHLFNSSSAAVADAGNIIIDSGTTLTYLPVRVYIQFSDLVQRAMGYKTVPAPIEGVDLCYRLSDKLSYPKIKVHFTGATIHLKPINTFIQFGTNVTCLAFYPAIPYPVIYGNVAQTNFLIGYDTKKGTVTFKPLKCGHASH